MKVKVITEEHWQALESTVQAWLDGAGVIAIANVTQSSHDGVIVLTIFYTAPDTDPDAPERDAVQFFRPR